MGSHWTDVDEILRDLSLAQGCVVPANVDGTVAGRKPPTNKEVEETEEEFYKKYVCSGNFDQPDFHLIRCMLDTVQSVNGQEEENDGGVINITKLNADAPQFVPSKTKETPTKTQKKHKKQRNAAIESMLQAITDNKDLPKMERTDQIQLLRPEDILLEQSISSTVGNNVCAERKAEKPLPSTSKKWKPCIKLAPSSMFRSKNIKKEEVIPKVVEVEKVCPEKAAREAELMRKAEQYYQQFQRDVELRDSIKETIWTRAERKMKELDDKRKSEVGASAVSSPVSEPSYNSRDDNDSGLGSIFLSQHRHLLKPGPCVVCRVLCGTDPASITTEQNNKDTAPQDAGKKPDDTPKELENYENEENMATFLDLFDSPNAEL